MSNLLHDAYAEDRLDETIPDANAHGGRLDVASRLRNDEIGVAEPERYADSLCEGARVSRRSRTARWALLLDSATVWVLFVAAPGPGWVLGVLLVGSLVALNAVGGRYRDPVAPHFLDELPGLAGRALVACGFTAVVAGFYGRTLNPRTMFIFVVSMLCGHLVSYVFVRYLRRRTEGGRNTLIVGVGPAGRSLATSMVEHPECGRRPIGWLDDGEALGSELALLPAGGRSLPWLGEIRELPQLMASHPDLDVVVADIAAPDSEITEVLRDCERCRGEIYVLPGLNRISMNDSCEQVRGLPLVRLRRAAHRTFAWRCKRAVDVTLGGLGLLVALPVILVCATLVLLEGGRGVVFRQQRIGMDFRPFDIFKLRSMTPATDTESQQRWSIVGDVRIGRCGRVLRTFSLDELPQLWNVVRGDMSLVGPRPERPYFAAQFSQEYPHYANRHRVPSGLTGLAQIHGLRGDTDIGERARLDNQYIATWSLWSDIKIMLRTFGCLITKAGS